MATYTKEIRVVKDAYVNNDYYSLDGVIQYDYRDTNYGKNINLVQSVNYENDGSIQEEPYLSFLKFDLLGNLPENAFIKKLLLNFTVKYISSSNGDAYDFILDLYKIAEDWQEDNVTWNNRPKGSLLKEGIVTLENKTTPYSMQIDLTDYANDLIYGIGFRSSDLNTKTYTDGSTYGVNYFTQIASNDGNPQLYVEVEYTADRPNTPEIINPLSGEVLNKSTTPTVRLDWQSNDQVEFELLYSQNNINFININQTTTNNYYDLDITGLNDGDFIWKVRVKDSDGIWSDYSSVQACKIGQKPTVSNLSIIGASRLTWDEYSDQRAYEIEIYEGDNLIESDIVDDAINYYELKNRLENNKSYTIKVRIKNSLDIWSDYETLSLTVNFQTPPMPQINYLKDNERCRIIFNIINPSPSAGEEEAIYNEVYRREYGQSKWNRIATDVDSQYTDNAIASKVDYEYKIVALGQTGYIETETMILGCRLNHSQLTMATDYDKYVDLPYEPKRSSKFNIDKTLMRFAGREKPVAEYGESKYKSLNLSFFIRDIETLEKLEEILYSNETLLYRDNRGRKLFCTVDNINIEDTQPYYWNVSFRLDETSYNEVV